jgi:pyrroline-5-carboxylate reductase
MTDSALPPTRWGFIGSGKMATALVRGMIRAGIASADCICASDPLAAARTALSADAGIAVFDENNEVVGRSDVVILAVKPQSMPEVLEKIRPSLSSDHLVISIAAGTTIGSITDRLAPKSRVVRVMPNTPALVGEGASAFAVGPGVTALDEEIVRRFLSAVGIAVRVSEPALDAVTGLSGSGPAFVYLMIEALSDGGVRMGLPRDVATLLAAQTVRGAARMVLETGEHPGALKDQVASPGGTTIAGLHALERAAVRGALIDAVESATKRSIELSKIAKEPPK